MFWIYTVYLSGSFQQAAKKKKLFFVAILKATERKKMSLLSNPVVRIRGSVPRISDPVDQKCFLDILSHAWNLRKQMNSLLDRADEI